MYSFILVHGSWHDGSAWDNIVMNLENAGHKAYAPTIAGHGKDADKNVNHAQCTQSIIDYIIDRNLDDFVLVGHSFGGTIIAKVAEQLSERIRRLVFCNAFVPLDGESLEDNVPPQHRDMFRNMVPDSGENTVMLPFPVWREAFINDAGLELAKESYALLSPEPYLPFIEKLDMKKFYQLEIPRSFINCTEDIALPPGEWGWHPHMSSRLGLYRLVQMPGSHEVVFTNPAGLAEKIIEAGRD